MQDCILPLTCCLYGCVLFSPSISVAIGFDSDDFIVAGFFSDTIAVYDSDFSFKGNLDHNFDGVYGLDFDHSGNVVAVAANNEVRVYNRAGSLIGGFSDGNRSSASTEIKVASDGTFLIGAGLGGLLRYTPTGDFLHQVYGSRTDSIVILPGDRVWAGGTLGTVREFDLTTGAEVSQIGFGSVSTMYYSANTDSVFFGDTYYETVEEGSSDGAFLRSYEASGLINPSGITRGPGGDLFVTTGVTSDVYHWNHDGAFMGVMELDSTISAAMNMLWAGNAVPEPTTLSSGCICLLLILYRRHLRIRHGVHA